jgi:hypothetical protein
LIPYRPSVTHRRLTKEAGSVNGEELRLNLPAVLEQVLSGRYDAPMSTSDGLIWVVHPESTLGAVLVREKWRPHVLFKAGVVLDAPFTPSLCYHVAHFNRNLWTGRLYLRHNPQENVGLALIEDIVFGDALDTEQGRGIEDLAWRIDWLMKIAGALSQDTIEEYGGQPFGANDAMFLDIESP